jgi:hypothetical protein
MSTELTATALKNALWSTLNDIKAGTIQPGPARRCSVTGRNALTWEPAE